MIQKNNLIAQLRLWWGAMLVIRGRWKKCHQVPFTVELNVLILASNDEDSRMHFCSFVCFCFPGVTVAILKVIFHDFRIILIILLPKTWKMSQKWAKNEPKMFTVKTYWRQFWQSWCLSIHLCGWGGVNCQNAQATARKSLRKMGLLPVSYKKNQGLISLPGTWWCTDVQPWMQIPTYQDYPKVPLCTSLMSPHDIEIDHKHYFAISWI